jgi:hypothetical protein
VGIGVICCAGDISVEILHKGYFLKLPGSYRIRQGDVHFVADRAGDIAADNLTAYGIRLTPQKRDASISVHQITDAASVDETFI